MEHQEMQRKVYSIGHNFLTLTKLYWKFCPILYVSCSRKFHFCSCDVFIAMYDVKVIYSVTCTVLFINYVSVGEVSSHYVYTSK